MKIRNQSMIATTLALAGLLGACATTRPPAQLVEARATYAESSSGLTAKLSPTDANNAVAAACGNSVALVGTTALFFQNVSAMNNCKGQNACKGQGFMNLSEKACVERLGRT